jgi:hypothetical protein
MKKNIIFCLIISITINSFSQKVQTTLLSDSDPQVLYLNDEGSNKLLYYDLTPDNYDGNILILLPGFYSNSKEIFQETKLPEKAYENNIATLVLTINVRLHLDSDSFDLINNMILDFSKRKNIKTKNIIFGGFSAGGSLALSYTEWMNKKPIDNIPTPKAVFVIDPPVDFYNFWFIEQRLAERKCSEGMAREAQFFMNYFEENFGGTPNDFPNKYKNASPYSRLEKNGGNLIYLKNTAVRAYCEPDINYRLEKCEDYYDLNAADLSAMINQLRLLENDSAEFITTTNKGYRMNGKRNPHSWSILDDKECIEWIKNILEK